MYTLTEITGDGNVTHHKKLGERFSVIDRETSPNEFEKAYNAMYPAPRDGSERLNFKEADINKNTYSLIISEGGREIFELDKNNFYYIVTENGKTFKNLTFK